MMKMTRVVSRWPDCSIASEAKADAADRAVDFDDHLASLCLAISWPSPSFVIGRHCAFSPASGPRKGTISNDDNR
jgi:hypothetical protein